MSKHPTEIITVFVGSVLALLIAFEVNVTEKQAAAIIGFFGTLPLFVTYVVESIRSAKRRG